METCPTCGEDFGSERAVKVHHAKGHGKSLVATEETCHTCGETFVDRRNRDRDSDHRFCSQECRIEWLESRTGEDHPNWSEHIRTACASCGEELARAPWRTERSERAFCDPDCLGAWRSENRSGTESPLYNTVAVDCEQCGTEILKPASRVDGRRHFCDIHCHGEWISKNKSGENGTNWQGGHDRYYGPNWNEQRREARERDDYGCQSCGMSNDEHRDEWGEDLHVHHITRFGAFDSYQKANRLNNLVTLCRSCHLGKWEGIPLRPDTRAAE
ncbi:HNH endonuclease [Halorarum salinum]|uniref:HNH endonuclease n=1 Tax=Halorarum salinum TaxID=2743089 RepID=A0A7D5QCI0_9EURY|nr:HNH endonuclease [Halobaculum salinum]QLG63079.1 HNH endonuclease [Halobaculum salinum]